MGFMAPAAVVGLALAAGGSAYNYMEKKKTQKAVQQIQDEAQGKIDANSAKATARWQEGLQTLDPAQQQAMQDAAAAKRMTGFEEATADVGDATSVMQTASDAPAIVKTEAAKQLGNKLSEMKALMQAKSRLGGWDDRGLATNIELGRTGQDISQLGNFSGGWSKAASLDAAERAQQHKPIGDILIGLGSLASMGAGAAGAASGAAGAAGAAGTAGAAAAPAAGVGDWLFQMSPWLFTPFNQWQGSKPKTGPIPKPIGYTGAPPVGVTVGASDTGIW